MGDVKTMKFYVEVVSDEDDNQQNLLRAYVQFSVGGDVYRLAEHPDPIHEISASDIREFVESFRALAEQQDATFDAGDAISFAEEIEQESE